MCNNSLIYLATPTASSILQGGVLPLTTIVRRRGTLVQQANDSVLLNGSGYYKVSVNATFTAPVGGIVELAVVQDGIEVQGANASTTITTATTEVRSLSFEATLRVPCYQAPSTISILNKGVAIDTSNIALSIEYLS